MLRDLADFLEWMKEHYGGTRVDHLWNDFGYYVDEYEYWRGSGVASPRTPAKEAATDLLDVGAVVHRTAFALQRHNTNPVKSST